MLASVDMVVICLLGTVAFTASQVRRDSSAQSVATMPAPTSVPARTPSPTRVKPTETATLDPTLAKALVRNTLCDTEMHFTDIFNVSDDDMVLMLSFARITCAEEPGYLGVFVGVQNLRDLAITVDPTHFGVIDFDKYSYTVSPITYQLDDHLQRITIPHDKVAMGYLIFEIGDRNAPQYLIYDDEQYDILGLDFVTAIQRQMQMKK